MFFFLFVFSPTNILFAFLLWRLKCMSWAVFKKPYMRYRMLKYTVIIRHHNCIVNHHKKSSLPVDLKYHRCAIIFLWSFESVAMRYCVRCSKVCAHISDWPQLVLVQTNFPENFTLFVWVVNLKTSTTTKRNAPIRLHLAFSIVLIIVGSDGQFKFVCMY